MIYKRLIRNLGCFRKKITISFKLMGFNDEKGDDLSKNSLNFGESPSPYTIDHSQNEKFGSFEIKS